MDTNAHLQPVRIAKNAVSGRLLYAAEQNP